jgi:hypothetical protein
MANNAERIFMRNFAVKLTLERQRIVWEDTIKVDVRDIYFVDGRGMELAPIVSKNGYDISGCGQCFGNLITTLLG